MANTNSAFIIDEIESKPRIIIAWMEDSFKCYFCDERFGKTLAYFYIDSHGLWILTSCLNHSICKDFILTGDICPNHADRLEVEKCNEVPF